jgi:DNA end-binding protein Ku
VIETFEGPLDLPNYKDEYREGLQRVIDAKVAGQEIVAAPVEAPPRVVNLMDALKKSLDAVRTTKKNRRRPKLLVQPRNAKGCRKTGIRLQ